MTGSNHGYSSIAAHRIVFGSGWNRLLLAGRHDHRGDRRRASRVQDCHRLHHHTKTAHSPLGGRISLTFLNGPLKHPSQKFVVNNSNFVTIFMPLIHEEHSSFFPLIHYVAVFETSYMNTDWTKWAFQNIHHPPRGWLSIRGYNGRFQWNWQSSIKPWYLTITAILMRADLNRLVALPSSSVQCWIIWPPPLWWYHCCASWSKIPSNAGTLKSCLMATLKSLTIATYWFRLWTPPKRQFKCCI